MKYPVDKDEYYIWCEVDFTGYMVEHYYGDFRGIKQVPFWVILALRLQIWIIRKVQSLVCKHLEAYTGAYKTMV